MQLKIALAGNPNCGKTTLFNDLTGSAQYVGNWPGVTVEKKEGRLRGESDVIIQDLPGVYSLSPYTLEERVARNYLIGEQPDVILNIVDGSNLERNLYLSTQLLELGLPMVIAVNMMDVLHKNGDKLHCAKLSEALGCPVVEISALKGQGTFDAALCAVQQARGKVRSEQPAIFDGPVRSALDEIGQTISALNAPNPLWLSTRLFERDEQACAHLPLTGEQRAKIEDLTAACEDALDDDAESILTTQRYAYLQQIASKCLHRKRTSGASPSDRIDRIVTHRFLALPIFALVMFVVYYISVTTVGALLTDFTNDTLFGEWILPAVAGALEAWQVAPWLTSLLVDGVIGGVGAVLGFVPQMLVLFLLLSLLEDCGYMARVAFIMDRIFRKFGLSGKSFIPMLIGSGCSVPGIMASRTIEQERDRRMTIMTTSFIPCGAKMPVVALIAGALFGGAWWVAPLAYLCGVAAVIISGIILKKTHLFAGQPAPFVIELPAYHAPTARNISHTVAERGLSFIRRAGTIILLSSVVLWFLQGFGFSGGVFGMVEDNNHSLLASVGHAVSPLFAPLGFGSWQASVGTFTGLIAKENVVGTLGVLYGFAAVAEDGMEYWALLARDFTALSAFSFLLFNLLCAPCFAAMGAIRREMNNSRWTALAIAYLCVFAYGASLVVYQLGLLFMGGSFTVLTALALAVLVGTLYLLLRKPAQEKHTRRRVRRAAEQPQPVQD